MKMENDPGLARMYEVLRQYDDGVIRAVAARKAVEIAELRLAIGEDEPTRNQGALLKYLDEDRIVYETVRGLSDLDLRMEDRAAGYVDDIIGIVNGGCEY